MMRTLVVEFSPRWFFRSTEIQDEIEKNIPLSHELWSEWMSERASKWAQQSAQAEQVNGWVVQANEKANGQGPRKGPSTGAALVGTEVML